MEKNKEMYLRAGYTHWVSYKKFVKGLGWLTVGFPTTTDAVDMHVKRLGKDKKNYSDVCYNLI